MGEFPNKETQFKPGESGNSNGRPKGSRNRQTIIKELLESKAIEKFSEHHKKIFGDDYKPETLADQLAAAMAVQALGGGKGAVQAFNALYDGAYGKMTEKIENEHTFTQMGRVKAQEVAGRGEVDLSFDVGSAPGKIPGSE